MYGRSLQPRTTSVLITVFLTLVTILHLPSNQAKAFSITYSHPLSFRHNIHNNAIVHCVKVQKMSSSSYFTTLNSSKNSDENDEVGKNNGTTATARKPQSSSTTGNWREFPMDYYTSSQDQGEYTHPSLQHKGESFLSPLFDYQSSNSSSSSSSSTSNVKTPYWSKEQYTTSLKRYNEFTSSQDSYIAPLMQEGLQTLLHAYRLYGPNNVIGSFNGGKDAVVIMELMKAAHAKYYHDLLVSLHNNKSDNTHIDDYDESTFQIMKPRMIYFNNKLEFQQVYDFVRDTVEKYDLEMIAFEEHISFVKGLDILVKRNNVISASTSVSSGPIPIPMSFVLGTRKADPNAGGQGLFAPSSTWMPPFMRVNPILNWTYGHTWHFLRLFKIPYCVLYDRGYTSLGTVEDTLPCPALLKVKLGSSSNDGASGGSNCSSNSSISASDNKDDNNSCDYWPAYMLKDWDQERSGRLKKEKKEEKNNSTLNNDNNDDTLQQQQDRRANKSNDVESDNSTQVESDHNPKQQDGTSVQQKATKDYANVANNNHETESVSSATTVSARSVGLLIIGDEILKGCIIDSNSHAAALALKANNVPLTKVSVVSDDLEEIVNEIEYMTSLVDVIITSGGVGPTHDDVTIKSVGKALDSAMIFNKDMANLLRSKMKNKDEQDVHGDDDNIESQLTEAQVKMSTLPECSKLRYLSNDEYEWPVLQCRNIFILPGVPQFFEKKVALVASYLSTELERAVQFKVVLSIDENSIVPILNRVVDNHPNVSFGSYPFVNHPDFKTVVTLEGRKVEGGSFRNSGRFLSANNKNDGIIDGSEDLSSKIFEQDEIDLNVKLALADLVNGMPEGSVLRVDNNNDLTFI